MVALKNIEKGNTLIVILILIVVVTIIGLVAIRESITSLKISTNSQAQALLMRNSDAYFFNIEGAGEVYKKLNASKFGFVGFASQPENIGKEVVFCFNQNIVQNFDTNTVGVISNILTNNADTIGTGKKKITPITRGACDPSVADNYTSGRKAVMTQVAIKVDNTPSTPLENFVEGTDVSQVSQPIKIRINTTSLMPAMASTATSAQIKSCLTDYPADFIIDGLNTSNSIADCLRHYNVPFNAQVAEYRQSNTPM